MLESGRSLQLGKLAVLTIEQQSQLVGKGITRALAGAGAVVG
jgi:hypothetical protein